jgi:hypothetical protein
MQFFFSQMRATCPAHLILPDPAILTDDDDDDDNNNNNNNNNKLAGVQIMKLLQCNFLQYPVTFSPLKFAYLPRHPVSTHPQWPTFFPKYGRPNFATKHNSQHYGLQNELIKY